MGLCTFAAGKGEKLVLPDEVRGDGKGQEHSVSVHTYPDQQNAPLSFTTLSLFYDGQFVTHEILSEKKFDKILADKGV